MTERHPMNTAIIVGKLGTLTTYERGGKKNERIEKVVVSRHNAMRGEYLQFQVEMQSPLGEPFVYRMEVAATAAGADLLRTKEAGERIVVEGFPQILTSTDRRYALADDAKGRNMRDMHMQVTLLRNPREDEPEQASAVWLEGTIIEPPRFMRHPDLRSLQIATTLLEVYVTRQQASKPGYPGLRLAYRDRIEVPIAISVDHEQAGYIYKVGNKVTLDGEIMQVMLTQYGDEVTETVAAVKNVWENKKEQLAGKPAEQNAGLRQYRKTVTRLTEQARSMIMVGFVEAGDGAEMLSFNQARSSRRDFVKLRRSRGAKAAEAISRRAAPQTTTEDAAKAEPAQPRRKADLTMVLIPAPVDVEAVLALNGAGD